MSNPIIDLIDSITITEILPSYQKISLIENPFKQNIVDLESNNDLFKHYLSLVVKTCMHSKCSKQYCLKVKNGKEKCRFGYPKDPQSKTSITLKNEKLSIKNKRNNPILNTHNIWQSIGWES